MNIGIIGTGHVATTLAGHWRAAGHTITLGSRTPDAAAGTRPVADVVRDNDVLVNAAPGSVSLDALGAAGPATYAGKVLIDVASAVTHSFELMYPNDSPGEKLQKALPRICPHQVDETAHRNVRWAPRLTFRGAVSSYG